MNTRRLFFATLFVWIYALVALAFVELATAQWSTISENFEVYAGDRELCNQINTAAEYARRNLAWQWLGEELPRWRQRCPIYVTCDANRGASGATSFSFGHEGPGDWSMQIVGGRRQLLESVLPHEVLHTVFATHFGHKLPRWADEGACATVEAPEERARYSEGLHNFLRSGRGIPTSSLVAMQEYPPDILPLYAQGHSLTDFLVEAGSADGASGQRRFVLFLETSLGSGWQAGLKEHYQIGGLGELQDRWLSWVKQGSPRRVARVAFQWPVCPGGNCVGGNCPQPMPQGGQWAPQAARPQRGIQQPALAGRSQPRAQPRQQPQPGQVPGLTPPSRDQSPESSDQSIAAAGNPPPATDNRQPATETIGRSEIIALVEAEVAKLPPAKPQCTIDELLNAMAGDERFLPQPCVPAEPAEVDYSRIQTEVVEAVEKDLRGEFTSELAAAIELARCKCQPPEPVGVSHLVLVAEAGDEDLGQAYEAAAGHMKILRAAPPDFPAGELPQLVVYRAGVPVRVFRGATAVVAELNQIARGTTTSSKQP